MENKEIRIPTLDERLQKAYEAVQEMNERDKTGLSLVEIMKPRQWLNNLLIWKAQMEAEKIDKCFTPSIEDIVYVRQATMLSEKAVKGFWGIHPNKNKEEIIKIINDGKPKIRILHS